MIKQRILSLVLIVMCMCSVAACGSKTEETEKETLIMATNAEFPPYEYYEGNEIVGIDAEFAAAIAEELGMELKIEDMAFDSIIPAVQSGKADFGAAMMTVTEERKTQIDFSDSYYTGRQVIIVEEDNTEIAGPDDLAGKKIGVQQGTTGDIYATGDYGDEYIERYNKGFEVVQALTQGKIDAVIIDDQPAQTFVRESEGLKILEAEYVEEDYALCFAKGSELVDDVNAAIAELKEDGTFDVIIDKYIDGEETEVRKEGGNTLIDRFKLNFIEGDNWKYIWDGFCVTLQVTFFAVIVGIVLGFLIAIVRSTHDKTGKLKFLNAICQLYLTVIRGTPVVVQLLIIYFVIFGSVDISKVLVAVMAFGLNSAAYVAEIFRSGIMSIDNGQFEAGRSLGFNYAQTMFYIIMPQAFKNVLPALGNEFIVLLKETSVSGYIALQDLTKGGDIIRSRTYDAFMPLIAVALIYLVMVLLFTKLVNILERRLRNSDH